METKTIKDTGLKEKILGDVMVNIEKLAASYNKRPGIAFIGFMGVPLGKYNIPFHLKMATDLGFKVFNMTMPDDISEEELFFIIDELNNDDEVHVIVLLQPLPEHLVPVRIMNRIDPEKEVEGFHPQNMLKTMMPDIAVDAHPMCLPEALKELFENNAISGNQDDEWVLLLDEEFYENQLVNMVTRTAFMKAVPEGNVLSIVNRSSSKLKEHCKRADFLVVVTKDVEYVQAEWLKEGVCIIDIYSNLLKEVPSKKDPCRLVPVVRGGVNVDSVMGKARAILPIPGGLMTIVLAILFRNAVNAFENSLKSASRVADDVHI